MKKIISLLLILSSIIMLASCSVSSYKPVESTEEESRTVMTVTVDGERYDIKYELYRALFLNFKSDVDGGDSSVWTGENKDEYIDEINARIKENVSDIYSTLHVAKKIGIDPYSRDIEKKINDAISAAVESDVYEKDYDKYLARLKELNLNYSAHVLMLRYAFLIDEIETYYAGDIEDGIYGSVGLGKLTYTEEDVRAFYDSDECVRVLRAFLSSKYADRARAERLREALLTKSGEDEIGTYMIAETLAGGDLKDGELIARHNLNKSFYGEMTDAAFALDTFGISEVMEIVTGSDENDGYIILYRAVKSEEYYTDCHESVVEAYVQNEIGKILDTASAEFLSSIEMTDVLGSLEYDKISMN